MKTKTNKKTEKKGRDKGVKLTQKRTFQASYIDNRKVFAIYISLEKQ